MADRQKFWLKVVLFVASPVWIPLGIAALMVAMPFLLLWSVVDEMVDPPKPSDWDGPW